MAGRRKKLENLSYEEQLEILTTEITQCESHLKELKEKRKQLLGRKEESQKEELYKAVMQSGKKLEDVIASLSE